MMACEHSASHSCCEQPSRSSRMQGHEGQQVTRAALLRTALVLSRRCGYRVCAKRPNIK